MRQVGVRIVIQKQTAFDPATPSSVHLLLTERLRLEVRRAIEERNLTQVAAGRILGMAQPRVSALLRGRRSGVSAERLLQCLTALGRDVEVRIKPADDRDCGLLCVTSAGA